MINTSEEYKKAVLEKRKFLAKATCLLKDGTLLEFDKSRLMIGGVTISDATSSSGSFDIGAAIVNQLTMKLNNMDEVLSAYDFTDAQITVWAGLQLENRVEWLKKGVFNASDPTETPAVLTLKALDNMSKFDKAYDGDIVFPSSIQRIVQHCCAKCGVLLASEKIPNGDYIINNPVQGDNLTYRVLISYCAVVAGCYARCNPDGALELKWYDRTAFSENGTHVDIKKFSSLSVSNVDVVITGIRVTASDGKDEKLKGETYLAGTEGYVLSISGNPFIEYGNAKTIASMLAERIVGMRFRPMNASCIGDPSVEAGDAAVLTDRKGRTYNCYLTSLTYSVGDYTSISCDAEPAARHSADRFKEIDKIISDIKEETRHELSQYGKYLDQMNGLAINAMGYYETVEIQDDGSRITYMHDKPLMSESMVIYKKSIDGYFWSKDGGKTWTSGIDKNGNAVMNVIAAIGLHAEWITSGKLQVSDDEGNIIFLVDMDTKQVLISGDSVQIGGRPVQDVINNGITESKNYSDKRLSDYANTVTKDIENLQSQVDGQVEDYYYDYEPSMQNIPASQWTTTEERKKHIGDRFFWKSKGYAYRFMENNGVWGWTLLQDTDITKAMQTAQEAKDTADGKRRTFITKPVPPYDIGDLWANGTDILTCSVSRVSGASYVASDWKKLNKYTDDTVANQALEEAKNAIKNLTQEQVFNKLTNNGAIKGIYMQNGQLYISFNYAKGGILTLGGKNNGNGILEILNSSGNKIGKIDKDGINISGELELYKVVLGWALRTLIGETTAWYYAKEFKRGGLDISSAYGGETGRIIISPAPETNRTLGDKCTNLISSNRYLVIESKLEGADGWCALSLGNPNLGEPSGASIKIGRGTYSGYEVFSGMFSGNSYLAAIKGQRASILVQTDIRLNGAVTANSLSVTGTKSRKAETINYDDRLLYCYEMPSPMFGDAGEAFIDSTGDCYIYLDDIFAETINTGIEYQVFLQKEGQGDLWVDSKEPAYFVVKGTPGLKFSWEIKAKQNGYEYERLENDEVKKDEIVIIDYEEQGQKIFEEYISEKENAYEENN